MLKPGRTASAGESVNNTGDCIFCCLIHSREIPRRRDELIGRTSSGAGFASCVRPRVMDFLSARKKKTVLPSLAYAGMPYQTVGRSAGALRRMSACRRSPISRKCSGMAAIFASVASPPSTVTVRQAAFFSGTARQTSAAAFALRLQLGVEVQQASAAFACQQCAGAHIVPGLRSQLHLAG